MEDAKAKGWYVCYSLTEDDPDAPLTFCFWDMARTREELEARHDLETEYHADDFGFWQRYWYIKGPTEI
jgi:hypothetical protein